MNSNPFLPAGKAQLLGSGRFYVDQLRIKRQNVCNILPHGTYMRRHFWRLGNNGGIDIGNTVMLLLQHVITLLQQYATVDIFILRIGVREVPADITGGNTAQQGITQRMNQNIAVRMRNKTMTVRDPDTTKDYMVTLTKSMHVITMTNTVYG